MDLHNAPKDPLPGVCVLISVVGFLTVITLVLFGVV